jgi:hypothetical protein
MSEEDVDKHEEATEDCCEDQENCCEEEKYKNKGYILSGKGTLYQPVLLERPSYVLLIFKP